MPEIPSCIVLALVSSENLGFFQVQDSGITTSFEIVKPSSIPTDGSEHKVTVGILDLEPSIQYKAVPKKVEQVFLEAKALNTSQYPILAGPASVFFGTNFVATVRSV